FKVHDTDLLAPTAIPYFTYGAAGTYNGNGFFNSRGNPGFEGIAGPSATATPEPGSVALLLTGATTTSLLVLRRRKK
ncbi:MAG: hypothetical protein JWN14_1779, partial [Chthonomonadales bacterium]|nr:hypothetical protein [Chthonomonadales bacterium]